MLHKKNININVFDSTIFKTSTDKKYYMNQKNVKYILILFVIVEQMLSLYLVTKIIM